MDLVAGLDAPCAPGDLYVVVADLATYPSWLNIVRRVVPTDVDDVWLVDLGARLGPFSRSKRLRMRRTVAEAPTASSAGRVRFERDEVDGRRHSSWVLDAELGPLGSGAALQMSLHYGGSMWLPVLDRLLRDEIERSRTRLVELVAG